MCGVGGVLNIRRNTSTSLGLLSLGFAMAHQLKSEDGSVEFRNRIVLERPKLAALLGAIAAEWGSLEVDIIEMYAAVMGYGYIRYPSAGDRGFIPAHPVALQVFDAIESRHHRMLLLAKLISWVFPDQAEEFRKEVEPAIRRAASGRNKFEHAAWGLCPKYSNALIHVPTFGHFVAYYESDFNKALDGIIEARNMVRKFERKMINSTSRKNPLAQGLPT